jgi:preprotein translocase subunit SecG
MTKTIVILGTIFFETHITTEYIKQKKQAITLTSFCGIVDKNVYKQYKWDYNWAKILELKTLNNA